MVQDATASQTTLPSQERSRRSAIPPTNFALCAICQRNTSKQKWSQFRLSECQLDSGASRLQKAAEIKHDQRIKLALRGEELFAKEVKYHKTCYKRFTRCVDQVKLDKETEQDAAHPAAGHRSSRIDFVVDTYPSVSTKAYERAARSTAGTIRVKIFDGQQSCPKQWKKFLSADENKLELVDFLVQMWGSSRYAERLCGVQLFVCHRQLCSLLTLEDAFAVLVSSVPDLTSDHEEADSRILLHTKHASNGGFSCVVISSSDTDVAVIGIHHANAINASLLWLTGTKVRRRCINVAEIAVNLGEDVSAALSGIHSFSGCDTTSVFVEKGKTKIFR